MSNKGVIAELYSENDFWEKLRGHAADAGGDLIHKSLVLYYTLIGKNTPTRVKASIMGALAYFIVPFDAIPDAVVGIGYLDDLGVLTWAIDINAKHIDEVAESKAKLRTREWFSTKNADPTI